MINNFFFKALLRYKIENSKISFVSFSILISRVEKFHIWYCGRYESADREKNLSHFGSGTVLKDS